MRRRQTGELGLQVLGQLQTSLSSTVNGGNILGSRGVILVNAEQRGPEFDQFACGDGGVHSAAGAELDLLESIGDDMLAAMRATIAAS